MLAARILAFPLLVPTLLLGVSAPALAGDYYNDACVSLQGGETWVLSLSTVGDHAVQLWREDGDPRVRVGTYQQNDDDVTARLEDIHVHLRVASGDASWQAGSARGTFSCRYQGDQRMARWQDAPADPPPFVIPPGATATVEPPAPAHVPNQICDLQGVCYSADGASSPLSHVPVTIEGDQAMVSIRIGGMPLTALVDTGATSMSLPENMADTLIASGQATEGPTLPVTHADGRQVTRRSIIVGTVTVGGHAAHGIETVVEPEGALPLIGFRVLREMSSGGRVAINFANSTLDFE